MYAICLCIVFLAGGIIAYALRGCVDGRANARAGELNSASRADDAAAAERAKQLENAVARAESANAEALKTIKGLQDLLDTVRQCNSDSPNPEVVE